MLNQLPEAYDASVTCLWVSSSLQAWVLPLSLQWEETNRGNDEGSPWAPFERLLKKGCTAKENLTKSHFVVCFGFLVLLFLGVFLCLGKRKEKECIYFTVLTLSFVITKKPQLPRNSTHHRGPSAWTSCDTLSWWISVCSGNGNIHFMCMARSWKQRKVCLGCK